MVKVVVVFSIASLADRIQLVRTTITKENGRVSALEEILTVLWMQGGLDIEIIKSLPATVMITACGEEWGAIAWINFCQIGNMSQNHRGAILGFGTRTEPLLPPSTYVISLSPGDFGEEISFGN
ncbi:hypothetical protein BDV26DRAFT_274688 [Aspergillus bertholletiae]|uniref:Uncharacterized protein n=1 Tax=Aspergillus bertholletiae TaxID=1226010 RepID=A0A5N7ASX5_9EURO|nr:hypothetical protein BDV26DRAFT_274688 [Aspergillus bertholletiae]